MPRQLLLSESLRTDAEALARVLGNVDSQEIKHDAQIPTQHPLFSPLFEQWELFTQFLMTQEVRQCTIKTADDRLAVIWTEKFKRISALLKF